MAWTYVRFELLRTFRMRRFVFLSLAFPLVLYYVTAIPSRNEHDLGGTGISATTLNCGRGQMGTVTHTYPGSLTLPAGESDKDSDEDCV